MHLKSAQFAGYERYWLHLMDVTGVDMFYISGMMLVAITLDTADDLPFVFQTDGWVHMTQVSILEKRLWHLQVKYGGSVESPKLYKKVEAPWVSRFP